MSKKWKTSAAILSVVILGGCGSSDNSSNANPNGETLTTQPVKRPIPPDSPFAKVKEGMGSDEVFATIGQPTSMGSYVTGKAFIPFHYGGDNSRSIARYKGIGTITFSQNHAFTSGTSVMSIDYDPEEPGFERH